MANNRRRAKIKEFIKSKGGKIKAREFMFQKQFEIELTQLRLDSLKHILPQISPDIYKEVVEHVRKNQCI
jgi:hypothetical protein